jgi:PhnB protein
VIACAARGRDYPAADNQEAAMAIQKLNPYLNFDGTAAKAIALYEKALGAKAENVQRFGDVAGMNVAPENKDRVMHAELHLGEGVVMISDGMPGVPVPSDSNTHVTLHFDDPADMGRRFEALAAGGKITMPMQDTFWGAKFGMVKDAYGISWMFNCDVKKT